MVTTKWKVLLFSSIECVFLFKKKNFFSLSWFFCLPSLGFIVFTMRLKWCIPSLYAIIGSKHYILSLSTYLSLSEIDTFRVYGLDWLEWKKGKNAATDVHSCCRIEDRDFLFLSCCGKNTLESNEKWSAQTICTHVDQIKWSIDHALSYTRLF